MISEAHKHDLEILWDGGDWKRVRCKDPECDFEEEVYYGDDLE